MSIADKSEDSKRHDCVTLDTKILICNSTMRFSYSASIESPPFESPLMALKSGRMYLGYMCLTTFAGTPAATVSAGMSRVTTAPAPITELSPIVTPCRMVALEPTHTFFPRTIGAE